MHPILTHANTRFPPRHTCRLVLLSLLLASCGGGGGGSAVAPTDSPVATPATPVTPAPGIPAPFEGINQALDARAPSASGQNGPRSATITEFDARLWATDESTATPADIVAYYAARTARIATEIAQPVTTGFRVWALYNHGFIVKTPTTVFAFDLVEGKSGWNSPAWTLQLPQAILDRIDILMVSHEHGDHYDETERIPAAIKARGGAVLYPAAGVARANTTRLMADRQSVQIKDVKVTSYEGLHNAPTLIYEVVTADGYRVVHTGDNQTSATLPALEGVDLLLLNGWINESGQASNVSGMKNAIDKLRPAVMIPGHFEELAHPKGDSSGRYRYTDALSLQDSLLVRSKTVVLTWGERMDFTEPACGAGRVRIYADCALAGATPSDVVPGFLNLTAPIQALGLDAPVSLASAGSALWVTARPAGTGPGTVLRLDKSTGAYQSRFSSPGGWPDLLTHDGTHLWLIDYIAEATGGKLQLFKLDHDGNRLATFQAPQSTPAHRLSGLASDGKRLYLAEWVNNPNTGEQGSQILELDASTGQVLRTVFSNPDTSIQGLALRHGSLWFTSQPLASTSPALRLVNLSIAGVELSALQLPATPRPGDRLGLGLSAGHDYFLSLDGFAVYKFNQF